MQASPHGIPPAAACGPCRLSVEAQAASDLDFVDAYDPRIHTSLRTGEQSRISPRLAVPPRHEWWTRRIALGLGGVCVASGAIILAHASMLQTPLGALLLYAYEHEQRPDAKSFDISTLHDWAIAQGIALGVQSGALGLIAAGFGLAIYAVH